MREHRIRIAKILNYIYSSYKIAITIVFDYRISSYYENFIFKTNTLSVGFEHGFHKISKYSYPIFVTHEDFALKFLLFNQICDIYFFALINYKTLACRRYFIMYRLYFFERKNVNVNY